jgi:4-amino-4-deoxy-L-arabinose transferase-like glycosyltransferase
MTLNEAYGDRQTQTAFPARVWREDGFEPFLPTVPVFGNGGRELMLEFPIFQWVIYAMSFVSPTLDFAARLAGLIFFQMSAFGLFWLTRQVLSKEIALAVLVVYQFNAYSMKWGSTATVDLAVIAFLMLGLAAFARALLGTASRTELFIVAWLCFAASASIKPWGLAIWLPMALLLLIYCKSDCFKHTRVLLKLSALRALGGFVGFIGLALVPALIWNSWASDQRRGHEDALSFILGTVGDRTIQNVAKILQFEFGFVIGGVFVAGVLLAAFMLKRRKAFLSGFESFLVLTSLTVACMPIIFFTKNFAGHNYYSILVTPAVVLFGVLTSTRIMRLSPYVSLWGDSLAGAWLLIVMGYLNYLVVEGGQLLLGAPNERYETGGALATLLASIASVGCASLLMVYLLKEPHIRTLNKRFLPWATVLSLALLISFGFTRWTVDTPRFLTQIALSNQLSVTDPYALVIGCDATTVHYYTGSRGLSLGALEFAEFNSTPSYPINELSEFNFVTVCSPGFSLADLKSQSAGFIYAKGSSFGGEYLVSLKGLDDFEEAAPGLFVKP